MRNTITTLVFLIAISALFGQRLDRQVRKSVEGLMESFEGMEPEKANRINVLARTIFEKSKNEDKKAIQFVSSGGKHHDLTAAVWFRTGLLYRGMQWDKVLIKQDPNAETADSVRLNLESYGFRLSNTASADGGMEIDYGSDIWHIRHSATVDRDKEKVIMIHLRNSDPENGWEGEVLRTDEQHLASDVLYLSFRLSNLLQLE